jgi:membrane fusion protein, multidrug efflux system
MTDLANGPATHDDISMVPDEADLGYPPRVKKDSRVKPPATESDKSDAGLANQNEDKLRDPSPPVVPPEHHSRGEDRTDVGDEAEGTAPHQSVSQKLRAHWIAVSVAGIVLIGGAVGGGFWYRHSLNFASTDDAFIDGRPVSINPQVTGTIVAVPVTDNQIVRVGDLLLEIDDRDYVAAVNLAKAQIDQAEASVANFRAQVFAQESQILQASKQVISAQATLEFSKDQNVRYQDLAQKGAGTAQRAQQASSEFQSTGAAVSSAQAAQKFAEGQINVLRAQEKGAHAQVAQAQAQKETAETSLMRTKIYATVESRVTKLTAAPGQLATQAQAVMILVPLDAWVTANFKETQLANIKVGQPVSIAIDAFGKSFPGHIDSVQSGSGTAFSLLPAQNATGNYVKVVQRIPVKITFDERPTLQIGPGMSVVPTVSIR